MDYFVKEWPNRKASIVAEDGYLLDTFNTLKEAIFACRQGCHIDPLHVESHHSYLQSSPLDFEASFVTDLQ